MSSKEYPKSVVAYLRSEGYDPTPNQLRDGTVVASATRESETGTERLLAMIVTEPETAVRREHLDYLVDAREELEADEVLLTATVPITDELERAARDRGVEFLHPDAVSGGSGAETPTAPQQPAGTGSPQESRPPADTGQQAPTSASPPQQPPADPQPPGGQRTATAREGGHPTGTAQQRPHRRQPGTVPTVRRNLFRGGLYGLCAYLVGFALSGLFVSIDDIQLSEAGPGQETVVGWVFYATHNVEIEISDETGTETVDMLAAEVTGTSKLTDTVPELVYLLVPVVVLAGTGFLLYQNSEEVNLGTIPTAALGSTVLAGYLPVVVLGTAVFEYAERGVSWAPELGVSVLVAGLVYPAVCGAVGAVAAHHT